VALFFNAGIYPGKKFLFFCRLKRVCVIALNRAYKHKSFFFVTRRRENSAFLPKFVDLSHFFTLATVPRQARFVENPQKALRQNAQKFYLYTFRRNFDGKIVQFEYLQILVEGV